VSGFSIKRATRQGIKPLIGLYSESGCGKTYSSLLLARGLVGPAGKIVMIDTESGRGSLYADVLPGGYDVIELESPFSPERYIEALNCAAASGAGVVTVDSASHAWENIGGVLDMAAENEAKSGRAGLHNWKEPKLEHAKFLLAMLRFPLPLIVCLRAKYKTRQTKENGKTVIVKDNVTTPIQSEEFIFEMTAHAEILPDHSINLTKHSHPELKKCFPDKGPITIQHGEMIAQWCAAPKGPGTATAQTGKPAESPTLKALKKQLWDLTQPWHGGLPEKLNQHLWDEDLIDHSETSSTLTEAQLKTLVEKIKSKIALTP
jgi:hypothetical protein